MKGPTDPHEGNQRKQWGVTYWQHAAPITPHQMLSPTFHHGDPPRHASRRLLAIRLTERSTDELRIRRSYLQRHTYFLDLKSRANFLRNVAQMMHEGDVGKEERLCRTLHRTNVISMTRAIRKLAEMEITSTMA
jgi:hypothetical protein